MKITDHPLYQKTKHCVLEHFQKNKLLILSFFTGIFGATVAIVIKNLLHFTSSTLSTAFPDAQVNYFYLAFPFVGIVLTVLFVNYFIKDNLSHGVSIVLNSISNYNGYLRTHNVYSSIIASAITVGFGGSVGLEAPIVLTGAAVGSTLARTFKLSRKETIILLACGSCGAMAAIFKAPIAAIVFAIEVLMLDLTATAIVPLLVSAAIGTILSLLFLGEDVMLSNSPVTPFQVSNVGLYVLLGVAGGLVSVYFLRVSRAIERLFSKIGKKSIKIVLGSLLLGGVIFVFPVLYGEGYENIAQLINNQTELIIKNSPLYTLTSSYHLLFVLFIAGIIFIKVIATALTNAAGGVGGVFAPSLFAGAFLGYLIADILNHYFGMNVPITNCVLAGMSALLAGVMHAPLTGIFLIAELTTGYDLLIPLMITSSLAYLTSKFFEPHSVYTRKLAEKGKLKTHNKDKFAIKKIDFMSLLDSNIMVVPLDASLNEYVEIIAKSKRNIFVVLDKKQKFSGLLLMDEHRDVIFNPLLYDTVQIKELIYIPKVVVYNTDSAEEMASKFQKTDNFNLPVITKDGTYLGFLSRAKVLKYYKDIIAEESDD